MQIGEPAHASYCTHILFALNITFNLGARAVVSLATTSHIKNIGRSNISQQQQQQHCAETGNLGTRPKYLLILLQNLVHIAGVL